MKLFFKTILIFIYIFIYIINTFKRRAYFSSTAAARKFSRLQ